MHTQTDIYAIACQTYMLYLVFIVCSLEATTGCEGTLLCI